MRVSWFSAGASSAVATKLAATDLVIYTHIDDQHPDTMRFVADCAAWFRRPVERLQSPLRSVEAACLSQGYVNGVHGAPCTKLLKRRTRREWELAHEGEALEYVWGFDASETERAERVVDAMPEVGHIFPLIERGIGKAEAHEILRASKIKRPAMYGMGYNNNNCIGCVKGGRGYWNHIRRDFPEVFAARAAMERRIGGTCIRGVYLDELDPKSGRDAAPIVDDCGLFCEVMAL